MFRFVIARVIMMLKGICAKKNFLLNASLSKAGDSPGGQVVKTSCFHFKGHEFHPWLMNYDSMCCAAWSES